MPSRLRASADNNPAALPCGRFPSAAAAPLNAKEQDMVRVLSSAPKPGYEKFLFATVGQDGKGVELSVLSVLARADLDPWAEAASLALLPRGMAVNRLSRIVADLPGIPAEQAAVENIQRLIALLPSVVVHPEVAGLVLLSDKNIRLMAWVLTLIVAVVVTAIFQWANVHRLIASHTTFDRTPHLISSPGEPTNAKR